MYLGEEEGAKRERERLSGFVAAMATASLPPGFGGPPLMGLPADQMEQNKLPHVVLHHHQAKVNKKVSWAAGDRLCQVIRSFSSMFPPATSLLLRCRFVFLCFVLFSSFFWFLVMRFSFLLRKSSLLLWPRILSGPPLLSLPPP